jgi:hypothetical protein
MPNIRIKVAEKEASLTRYDKDGKPAIFMIIIQESVETKRKECPYSAWFCP